MFIRSFRDQSLHPGDWALLLACYIVPLLNLIFLPIAWFLFPLFALLVLLLNPRAYLVRFHFVQALLAFLILAALTVCASLLSAINSNHPPYLIIAGLIFWFSALSYVLLVLLTLILLCFRRYLALPLISRPAERFANRGSKASSTTVASRPGAETVDAGQ